MGGAAAITGLKGRFDWQFLTQKAIASGAITAVYSAWRTKRLRTVSPAS
jgi:hypothetical protein